MGDPAPNANGVPGVESGVENEKGFTEDPAVAVDEIAGDAALVLLEVLKLKGLASALGVAPPNGFAEGVEEPKVKVGLGGWGVAVFGTGSSKTFVVLPSGTGDGVGVGSTAPAPKEPNAAAGLRGEGGSTGGVAEGVTSGSSEDPKPVGLLDGRLRPDGWGLGAADSTGLEEPNEKGEGWVVSFIVEVEEPNPNPTDEGVGLGTSGAGAVGFGAGAAIFFDSSKSFTTFARCSVYCANNAPTSQNMSASIARFTDSTNA